MIIHTLVLQLAPMFLIFPRSMSIFICVLIPVQYLTLYNMYKIIYYPWIPTLGCRLQFPWPSICKKLSISYQSIKVRVFDLLTLACRLSVSSWVSYPKAGMAETGYEVSSFLALPFSFFFYPTCIDYLLQAK